MSDARHCHRFRSTWLVATSMCLGCYTITPSLDLEASRVQGLPRIGYHVLLVVSESYRGYTSYDRGHPLADPQVYEIGEALVGLTEQYFRASFSSALLVDESELSAKDSEGRLLIWPEVASFDNTLTMFPTTQRLDIRLVAEIESYDGATMGRAEGVGTSTHRVHLMRDDEQRIGGLLSEVIQRALADLVQDVVTQVKESDRGHVEEPAAR